MLLVSLVGALAPEILVGPLGVSLSGGAAMNEMRAGYGSHLVLAVVFAWGAFRPRARQPAILLLVAEFGSVLALRLSSFAMDGVAPAILKPMSVEVAVFVLASVALLRQREGTPRGATVSA